MQMQVKNVKTQDSPVQRKSKRQFVHKMEIVNRVVKNCKSCRKDHYVTFNNNLTFTCPKTGKLVEVYG